MSYQRACRDAEATIEAGRALAALLRPGDIVILTGRLGAGKTTFVQGVAQGLGVIERVTSPTFTLLREHQAHNERGVRTLLHADVYRIERVAEARDLDLGELVEEAAVAMVEWGELASDVFGRDCLQVEFVLGEDVNDTVQVRSLRVTGVIDAERADHLQKWSDQ